MTKRYIPDHPIYAEWHPTKNSGVNPKTITWSSTDKVWWLGAECGHEWEADPYNRTHAQRPTLCPICNGKQVLAGFNDLASQHPLVAELYSAENPIPSNAIHMRSNSVVLWECKQGHKWEQPVVSKVKGGAICPIETGRILLPGYNDAVTHYPNIHEVWSPQNTLSPEEVVYSAVKKFQWVCEKGHERRPASIKSYYAKPECETCIAEEENIAAARPDWIQEFSPNNPFLATEISIKSTTAVEWLCDKGHLWVMSPNARSKKNSPCVYCSGMKVLTGYNDLFTTNPELISEWHPTRNAHLNPSELSRGSKISAVWVGECGHEWEATIGNKALKGSGCPYCAGKKTLTGFNDLLTRHPELAAEYSPNNPLPSNELYAGSAKPAEWVCRVDSSHVWSQSPHVRASLHSGCPYCSGHSVLADFNSLSVINPKVASEWHPTLNGDLSPDAVTRASGNKVWWLCSEGDHVWQAVIGDRTNSTKSSGCPDCSTSGGEKELQEFIMSLGFTEDEVQFNKRNIIKPLELDIYIPALKIALEYNGIYWHSEAQGKSRLYHQTKWKRCKDQGIQLLQVWEDDWKRNPEQMKQMLARKLQRSTEDKIGARKTVIHSLTYKDATPFLDANHIQGTATGTYYLGLKDKTTQELVAVLVLKKEAGSAGKKLNIVRYATNKNVQGGFTKLLNHAERTYKPEEFITFSDHSISDGSLYEKNGFTADKELNPDYSYLVLGKRSHKFGYRLKRFREDPKLKYEEGLTERELALLNKLPRIWDSGKTRWVKVI